MVANEGEILCQKLQDPKLGQKMPSAPVKIKRGGCLPTNNAPSSDPSTHRKRKVSGDKAEHHRGDGTSRGQPSHSKHNGIKDGQESPDTCETGLLHRVDENCNVLTEALETDPKRQRRQNGDHDVLLSPKPQSTPEDKTGQQLESCKILEEQCMNLPSILDLSVKKCESNGIPSLKLAVSEIFGDDDSDPGIPVGQDEDDDLTLEEQMKDCRSQPDVPKPNEQISNKEDAGEKIEETNLQKKPSSSEEIKEKAETDEIKVPEKSKTSKHDHSDHKKKAEKGEDKKHKKSTEDLDSEGKNKSKKKDKEADEKKSKNHTSDKKNKDDSKSNRADEDENKKEKSHKDASKSKHGEAEKEQNKKEKSHRDHSHEKKDKSHGDDSKENKKEKSHGDHKNEKDKSHGDHKNEKDKSHGDHKNENKRDKSHKEHSKPKDQKAGDDEAKRKEHDGDKNHSKAKVRESDAGDGKHKEHTKEKGHKSKDAEKDKQIKSEKENNIKEETSLSGTIEAEEHGKEVSIKRTLVDLDLFQEWPVDEKKPKTKDRKKSKNKEKSHRKDAEGKKKDTKDGKGRSPKRERDEDVKLDERKKKPKLEDGSVKAKEKRSESTKNASNKRKNKDGGGGGTTAKLSKEDKKKQEEESRWKWWEETNHEDGKKWKFLEHKGPYFAPPYEPLPDDVRFYYDGQEMKLSLAAEEVATFYAKMLDHEYTTKEAFQNNFFTDWKEQMTKEERKTIKHLYKCDFSEIHKYFFDKNEARKALPKEEKQKLKEEASKLQEEYGYCTLDGHREKIGNFKIEPPGLFRGRGDHPKMGMLKLRIRPEDVIINCSQDSKIPEPPAGHRWKEVRFDHSVTWLASWTENIQNSIKYIMLNPSSKLKGEKDWQKYEMARRLKGVVDQIRAQYKDDWKSREMKKRQRAVALYFIDKLALRAGNEKEEGETADTVGCCSLRVEHIKLFPELDGQKFVVEFDFLGKDSIRYYNKVPVEKEVFKNLNRFMENKNSDDELFDRLNTSTLNKHLQDLMEGLTAKVFRTYNASITLQNQLKELTNGEDNVAAKILSYNRANRAVALLCNHQRAPPKTFEKSMQNLQAKIDAKEAQLKEAKQELKKAKADHKHRNTEKTKREVDKKKKQVERLQEQLEKLKLMATDKEENKQIALGTSKLNYLDPRITVAWCKKYGVPIEKIYNKTQRDKFAWAIAMTNEDFEF